MKRIIYALVIAGLFISMVNVKTVQAVGHSDGICNGPDEVIYILVIGTDNRSAGYLYGTRL